MKTSKDCQSRAALRFGVGFALVIALMSQSACKPKEAQQTPSRQADAPAQQDPLAQSVPTPQPTSPPKETPAPSKSNQTANDAPSPSIAGGWVNAGGACNSGAAVQFNSDGTYVSEGETGTWALDGKTLTVTTIMTGDDSAPATQGPEQSQGDVGEKAVLTVLSVTDDDARVVLSNGSNATWTRCKG